MISLGCSYVCTICCSRCDYVIGLSTRLLGTTRLGMLWHPSCLTFWSRQRGPFKGPKIINSNLPGIYWKRSNKIMRG